MKSLVLAEKPSVARDLAGTLGSFIRKDGYLENDKYVVSWAIGHLVGLANPEDYNPNLKKWSLNTLPIIPDIYTLKALPGTMKQFKILKTLLSRPDIDLLINSCDAGRDVVDFPKSYGCTGYREGCKFAIWKEIAGKKITPTQAGTLLKKGKTGILKGFKSKEKKPFEAALALSKEGKVTFQFEGKRIDR